MLEALKLASVRRGFCSQNPAVGAVVVRDGKVISEGLHFAPGHPHAEVVALHGLDGKVQDCALYVTLEPCCHQGRTPPCTDRIIEAGIKQVFYGFSDPNPQVAGKGAQQLRAAGIDCQQLELAQVNAFYAAYRHWTLKQKPFVTAKIALSADGKIAGPGGKPVAITGPECLAFTHQHRLRSDAILTTATTIINDNPQLNCRQGGQVIKKAVYVLDSRLRMPLDAKLFATSERVILFYSNSADIAQLELLKAEATKKGWKLACHLVPASDSGLDLGAVLDVIAQDGVHDLWVEAGGKCFLSFFEENWLQRVYIYIAPRVLGGLAYSVFDKDIEFFTAGRQAQWRQLGGDQVCEILVGV
jgi:diaminohydroxyphosphoribosylaminopyrimidine deaminase/5-amino-6-(5-phosphoribosylamino)uracil reductase